MKKLIMWVIIMLIVVSMVATFSLVGCKEEATSTEEVAEEVEPAVEEEEEVIAEEEELPYDIALIVKATDSDFFQYVFLGSSAFEEENPDLAKVANLGPASETDIEQQVTILEDIIAGGIDAVAMSASNADSPVATVEKAMDEGLVYIDMFSPINSDYDIPLLSTDNVKGGNLAAEELVKNLEERNIPLEGTVGIISAVAGIPDVMDRDKGFIEKMAELAPNIEVLEPNYVDNDILKALQLSENYYTTYGDELIGLFADNNHTGDGVARFIIENDLYETIMVTAYDNDPEQIDALRNGAIKALIVQNPWGAGYKAIEFCVKMLQEESVPSFVDTGVAVITKENMDDEDIKAYLDPTIR